MPLHDSYLTRVLTHMSAYGPCLQELIRIEEAVQSHVQSYCQHVRETYLERAARFKAGVRREAEVYDVAPALARFQDTTHWPSNGGVLPESLAALAQRTGLPYTVVVDSWFVDRLLYSRLYMAAASLLWLALVLLAMEVTATLARWRSTYPYHNQPFTLRLYTTALLWVLCSGAFALTILGVCCCVDTKFYKDVLSFGRHHRFLHFLYLCDVLSMLPEGDVDGLRAPNSHASGNWRQYTKSACIATFWESDVRVFKLHADGRLAEEVMAVAESGPESECEEIFAEQWPWAMAQGLREWCSCRLLMLGACKPPENHSDGKTQHVVDVGAARGGAVVCGADDKEDSLLLNASASQEHGLETRPCLLATRDRADD